MANAEEILLGREGGLATLTINRPQALNALTLDNYRRFAPALSGWAEDPSVHAVVVRGAGGRAFCAGGDVRAVYEAGRGISGDPDLTAVFFREEYRADPPNPPISQALYRDHRRDHDGRRRRDLGQWRLSGGDRAHLVRDAGNRDRAVSRCRRDPVSEPLPGAYRPLSRPDRRPVAGGGRALLRLCHPCRRAGAGRGAGRGARRDCVGKATAGPSRSRRCSPSLPAIPARRRWRRCARRSIGASPATVSRRSSIGSRPRRRQAAPMRAGRRKPAPGC